MLRFRGSLDASGGGHYGARLPTGSPSRKHGSGLRNPMLVTVKGKQVDVGDALRGHVEAELVNAVSKYFTNPLESQIVLTREAHLFRADVTVHVGRGMIVQGQGQASDARVACDGAIDRVAKRLRRHKRRLRDHHKHGGEVIEAAAYVLAATADTDEAESAEDTPNGTSPAIVAELTAEIATLSVSDAVMRLDLMDEPALLFRHAGHGGLNLVYRRTDGNIGWVDPQAQGNGSKGRAPARGSTKK
jgi:ribosomal subunit interface protein